MYPISNRVVLYVSMAYGYNDYSAIMAEETFLALKNIFDGENQFHNVSNIYKECMNINTKLGVYIWNSCLKLSKENTLFDNKDEKINSILNVVTDSIRKQIRMILYPGNKNDLNELTIAGATHNMIVQFSEKDSAFCPTISHSKSPSFFQTCSSVDEALLYFEALLVDACICHYLGISDVAHYLDDKRLISNEKVLFLKELVKEKKLNFLNDNSKKLIKYVVDNLKDDTPYVSFFSIFTIATLDLSNEPLNFSEYCKLWSEFQKWYFEKHNRLFIKGSTVDDALEKLLKNNKFKGQISEEELNKKITKILNGVIDYKENPPFGNEQRYALIIFTHSLDKIDQIKQSDSLFNGKVHPATWDIISWDKVSHYKSLFQDLEIIPFIIK